MSPDEVTVECSWKIENIDKVWEKILWKEKLSQLAEETNINNCFSMSQKTSDPCPCSLKICLTKNRNFIALQILSEVPMIEVHGQYEEYLMTVRGELLDEVDGSALYECRIDLPKMQSEILLKFCKLKEATSVWLYGISAVTKSVETSASVPSLSGKAAGANRLLASLMHGLNQGGKNIDSIETIVDKKLREMEHRMMSRIDERLDRIEKRMEDENSRIIALLSDLKKQLIQ
uniref:Histone RNA hairpin-binding protein n=1 Tax=Daphnia magna TaxID=35525 RepID=A0A0P6CVR8_9CRUS